MQFKLNSIIPLFLLALVPSQAPAQDGGSYHPFLTDTLQISGGAFFPNHSLELSADGTVPGEDIDFDETLGVTRTQVSPSFGFRWNISKKWSIWGQWWKADLNGSETLTEDITWDDYVFEAGTSASAGVDNNVLRLFIGRELWSGPQFEFGVGAGVHWMDIHAFIEGQVRSNQGNLELQRSESSVSAPLPNIGGWYYYSPSAKWLLSAEVDWLSASVGDYDGSLWDVSVGVNYQISRHIGLGLAYQWFTLDVNITDDDWHGNANIKNKGPLLSLTATW